MYAIINHSSARIATIVAILIALALPAVASACPSCYGSGASGPMVDGVNTAILVMLGIIGAVLACVAFFFFMMLRRSYRLRFHTPELSH